jgi:hypothetical protein
VAEGLVGLGHLVGVLTPLDRGAQSVHRVDELEGQLLAHRLAAPSPRGLDQPPHAERDAAIADVYGRFTEAVLAEPVVRTFITFGLTDRYTWLQEDYPREDGEARRPLPYDDALVPKPAYDALHGALAAAEPRDPIWTPPKAE